MAILLTVVSAGAFGLAFGGLPIAAGILSTLAPFFWIAGAYALIVAFAAFWASRKSSLSKKGPGVKASLHMPSAGT